MKNRKIISPPPPGSFQDKETDPQGSYTGVPADLNDTPVQDADDL